MKRHFSGLASLALAVGALMGSTSAHALFVLIDDFNSPDVVVIDQVDAGATVVPSPGNVPNGREVSHELLEGDNDLAGTGSIVKIGSTSFPAGKLEIANGVGRDAEVKVNWTLTPGFVPVSGAAAAFLALTVVQADGNPTSLQLFVNNLSQGTFVIPPNTRNSTNYFALSAATQNALAAGGTMSLVLNGDLGWDLNVDNFGFQVPEPGSLALVGLGLLAAAATSRARRR